MLSSRPPFRVKCCTAASNGVRVDLGDGGECLFHALVEVLDPAQGAQWNGFVVVGIR